MPRELLFSHTLSVGLSDGGVGKADTITECPRVCACEGNIFDFDNDGAVAASDFIQFRLRFGGSI